MGRPRQVSDEQILGEMRRVVLMHGPNVSLELVAKPLEVTVPAILKRFGNRQALMLAALRPPDAPWIELVEEGPDDRPLRTQLLRIITEISNFMDQAVPCMSALRESGIAPAEVFAKSKQPIRGMKALQRWLEQARKKGLVTMPETNAAAYAIMGAIQSRAFYRHMMNLSFTAREQRDYLDELSHLFSRALTQ